MNQIILFFITILFGVSTLNAFDCLNKHLTKIDKIICSDTVLTKMDHRLNLLYSSLVKALPKQFTSQFVKEQRNWLLLRDQYLAAIKFQYTNNKISDTVFLRQFYQDRTVFLDKRLTYFNATKKYLGEFIVETSYEPTSFNFIFGQSKLKFVCKIDSGKTDNLIASFNVIKGGKEISKLVVGEFDIGNYVNMYIHSFWQLDSNNLFVNINLDDSWLTCCSNPSNDNRIILQITSENEIKDIFRLNYSGNYRINVCAGGSFSSDISFVTQNDSIAIFIYRVESNNNVCDSSSGLFDPSGPIPGNHIQKDPVIFDKINNNFWIIKRNSDNEYFRVDFKLSNK